MSSTTQTKESGFLQPLPTWEPKPYQERALEMMVKQASVGLLLDPGMGKTSTVLAGFDVLKSAGFMQKLLIIAPLRVCHSVWPNEVRKWQNFAHLRTSLIHGSVDQRLEALRADADIYLINPEGLLWLLNEEYNLLQAHDFDGLCVDESTRFKNTTSKRFKLLRKYLPTFRRRWILSGTPAPNGIIDLFGQMLILEPSGAVLGKYITHFRNTYFIPSGYGGYDWKLQEGAGEKILDKISPFVIRLTAEEHLDMPELRIGGQWDVLVDLPPKARKVYDEVQSDFITLLGSGALVASNAAAAGTKCRQIANGAVYFTDQGDYGQEPDITRKDWVAIHTAKLDALESLLEELSGQPALIFYEFDHDRQRIQERLDLPCLTGTSAKKGAKLVDAFNRGELRGLLAHPASAGHGLNLQESCQHVIWFGLTWNLENYQQGIDRVYRQGQDGAVTVHRILTRGTLDERVAEVLAHKDVEQSAILAAFDSA